MTERMGVLSSDGQCLQPSPLAARAMLRPAARRLAAVGIGFAGGWAVLYGALMPFGLGLTLGLAEDCFAPCAAGAALGLLLHGLGALSLRSLCQLCALGAAVAARWLLPQRFVPAALAGCGTLTGMALCFALGSSSGAWLCHGSGSGAGTRTAGGDPCRLRGRVRVRGALRAAARKCLWDAVQRLRRHGGGLSAARRVAGSGGGTLTERGKRPRARPQCGGLHPAGSRGAEPFLAGGNGERGLRGLAPAAGGFPLGHRQCT